jgi:hypothetical protein
MEEHLEYTRADDQRITRMETLMLNMNDKIDTISESINACQNNCGGNRSVFNKRLKIVEEKLKGEAFVKSWKEALFSKTTAVVLFLIAIVDFGFRFVAWGK